MNSNTHDAVEDDADNESDGWTFFWRFADKEAEKEYFARRAADPNYEPPVAQVNSPEQIATRKRLLAEARAEIDQKNEGLTPEQIKARDDAEWQRVMAQSEPDVEAIRAKMARNVAAARTRDAADKRAASEGSSPDEASSSR